ncbi:MAG: CHAT domain-containing protein [Bryobacterales bacterium]|nr:CHAT domain-containing protein [Bryobacterales bacterium]
MAPVLDLALLDTKSPEAALVLARANGDFATAVAPLWEAEALNAFRDLLERAVRGVPPVPSPEECVAFGQNLFGFLVRDDVKELWERLPESDVRLQILSTHPLLTSLPWEMMQEPGILCGPRRERMLARIVSAEGHAAPRAIALNATVRVLFVSASPRDQVAVDFESVKASLEYAFRQHLPKRFKFTVVDGATKKSFRDALAENRFDILHFSGHGDVSPEGVGRLVFINPKTRAGDFMEAPEFGRLVSGLGLRMVVLSACSTADGKFEDDFAVLSAVLIREGIPAVVANQLPVPNNTVAAFVGGLYRGLLRDGDIDRAMVEGRLQLAGDLRSFEWAIPVLYRHYQVTHLFEEQEDDAL